MRNARLDRREPGVDREHARFIGWTRNRRVDSCVIAKHTTALEEACSNGTPATSVGREFQLGSWKYGAALAAAPRTPVRSRWNLSYRVVTCPLSGIVVSTCARNSRGTPMVGGCGCRRWCFRTRCSRRQPCRRWVCSPRECSLSYFAEALLDNFSDGSLPETRRYRGRYVSQLQDHLVGRSR